MRPTDIVIDAEKNLREKSQRLAHTSRLRSCFLEKEEKNKREKEASPMRWQTGQDPLGGGRGCAVIEEFFLRVYTNKYTNILEADFKMLYLRCKPNI